MPLGGLLPAPHPELGCVLGPGIEQRTETQCIGCLSRGVIRAKPGSTGEAVELGDGGQRRAGGSI